LRAIESLADASPELVALFAAAEQRGRVAVLEVIVRRLRSEPDADVLDILAQLIEAEGAAGAVIVLHPDGPPNGRGH
jgi:hypothetical protein